MLLSISIKTIPHSVGSPLALEINKPLKQKLNKKQKHDNNSASTYLLQKNATRDRLARILRTRREAEAAPELSQDVPEVTQDENQPQQSNWSWS